MNLQRNGQWRALCLVVILLFGMAVPVAAMAAPTKEEVDAAKAEREVALERLRDVNARLQTAVAEYQKVNAELEDLTWRISQLFERVREYEGEVRVLRDQARALVLEAYVTGGGGELVTIAFEAGSIQDILTSKEIISRATDFDLVTLDRLQVVRRELDRLKTDLEVDQLRVAELRTQAEAIVEELDALYAEADAEYHSADAVAREAQALFDAEQRRLRLLELARKQGASAGVGDGATPGFVCPVPSGTFTNDWGNPRSGGRTHKGTDIFASRGAPIVAVGDGEIRASSNSLGGTVLFLKADHGVTYYYAHLDSYAAGISTGVRVAAGQTIGYTGNSGNAIGTSPHTHFEVHPGGGAAVNPYPTLARNC